jgi:biotin synthase-related radical SAM superfamily protein
VPHEGEAAHGRSPAVYVKVSWFPPVSLYAEAGSKVTLPILPVKGVLETVTVGVNTAVLEGEREGVVENVACCVSVCVAVIEGEFEVVTVAVTVSENVGTFVSVIEGVSDEESVAVIVPVKTSV